MCGRRWGKTATGLLSAIKGHGPSRNYFKGAAAGGTIWWVAPSYPQIVSSGIWRDLKRACSGAWVEKSEVDRRIELHGGGSITVRSADNDDTLRGPGLDGLVIDEAARVSGATWREVLRPALSDKGGWALLGTTPNGKNWIHKAFVDAPGKPDWEAWQRPSWDNPLVSMAEVESLRRELGPRAFDQEHGAKFTDVEGALFPSEYFEDHVWATDWPDQFEFSTQFVDPSIGSESNPGDYSAIIFTGLARGQYWVKADIKRRTPMQIIEDSVSMYQQFRPMVVGVESNGFQTVLQPLFGMYCQQQGIPPIPLAMVNHHEKKKVRIQRIDPYFDSRLIRIFRDEHGETLVEQCQMYPDSAYHDDGPDALEGAIRLLNEWEFDGNSE